jgi:hypothetical protein
VTFADPAPDAEPKPSPPEGPDAPVALDGLVYGIDLLDALLVLHLGDAHLYASWVRPESGLRPDDVVTTLRDTYRVAQFTAKRLTGGEGRRGEAPAPVLTLELAQRTALLRRIRSYVVATIFDGAMPLGMARMISARLAAALEPELPLGHVPAEPQKPRIAVPALADPVVRDAEHKRGGDSEAPHTLTFGSGLPRRSRPPPPRAPEADRVSRLLAYLETHAPEPHVVKFRLALRAGLTLSALEHPEALGPEAMILIETAVQDILGIDRAELRRIA